MTAALSLTVDDDEDFEDAELPEVFRCSTLDTDRASAERAGEGLTQVADDIMDTLCRLELIERALRDAEPHSQRARHARGHVRRALAGFEEILAGVDHAACALTFHWDTTGQHTRAGTHRKAVNGSPCHWGRLAARAGSSTNRAASS